MLSEGLGNNFCEQVTIHPAAYQPFNPLTPQPINPSITQPPNLSTSILDLSPTRQADFSEDDESDRICVRASIPVPKNSDVYRMATVGANSQLLVNSLSIEGENARERERMRLCVCERERETERERERGCPARSPS